MDKMTMAELKESIIENIGNLDAETLRRIHIFVKSIKGE